MTFGPSEWMKKSNTKVIAYTRISDRQQAKEDKAQPDAKKKPALKQQKAFIDSALKTAKLPKATDWFAEVKSGTNRNREQWNKAMAKAQEYTNNGKRVFIVVQDPSRWARNTRHSIVAIDRLHEMGVPVFSAREGIQTGSVNDTHPTEELLFVQLQGGASFVSQAQKEKAEQSVKTAKEQAVMSGKGQPLWPFAREDPLEAYESQLPLATLPKKEGGGIGAFRDTVVRMTAPNGPQSENAVKRLGEQEAERRAKLTQTEYEEWRAYRTMIRDLLIELNHDPFAVDTEVGPINFKARALMRYVGRYLKEPWKYAPRPREELDEIMANPKAYLGTKDLKRYSAIVGKR